MSFSEQQNLIVIAGPTAVGKTSLSIQLAKHFKTEIISADSRQFYRELKIGTAVPSADELAAVKHHFIGNLSIHDSYNVSKYESEALETVSQLFGKHQNLILVGGSGLFIHALMNGIDELPDPDEELRLFLKNKLEFDGIEALRMMLKEYDPEYYDIVDLANSKRLLRALEVCITSGKKYSELRINSKKHRKFNTICIALNRDRSELNQAISLRTDSMMKDGLEAEARILFPFRSLNALNTVGYRELFDYFDGLFTFEEAIEKIKTNTRRYAKRQVTWFKKKEEFSWFHPDDYSGILNFINLKTL